ncbi:MAG: AMP-binding protein [Deltaproteobacteria bacterium HGW-Deltaproteobacteria-15]|jgi:long-chain acyl-CoA synthetase|nr:MAG: AMP-binding protein [Deltaproteobacteria bacterium HGW-Deltaproteobacteria-15]
MNQAKSDKGDTWPKVLKHNFEKYGDTHRAMRHKHFGIWQPYTWKDYYLQTKFLALGLLSLGFEHGDKLLIVGDNTPEWYYAELAAQADHGVSVGTYSELTPSETKTIAENSEARFAIVQDQEQVDKLLQIKHDLPSLKKVIYWSYKGLAHYDDPVLIGFRDVLELGKKYDEEHPGLFDRNVETGKGDDVCAIVYTSGTTGDSPKAAVHTYRTLRAGAEQHLRLDPWQDNDNVVPFLPPVWINEQWLGIGCHLLSACTLNFAEGPETQQRDARETGPSIVFHGARLWESQASLVRARILGANGLNRYAFRLLMPIGYTAADLKLRGKNRSLLQKLLYAFADVALFRSIRRSLGLQNARICYSTAAILSPDAFRFYHALNLPLKSLFGSTEGGTLAGARNEDIRLDTIGPAHEGTEVRISDEGEILCRSPGTFAGYYKEPDKTAEMLKDGWFHSGDCGRIGEDGHLVFVDRKKDLVPLAGGETLVPQLIESRLRFSPYIKDAWVFAGPGREYASAVVIIDYDSVARWAGQRRMAFTTFIELAQMQEVYDLVKQDIDRVNRTLPVGSRMRKYVNLHKEFDPDEGELTRTRKLRRAILEERYHEVIDAIYRNGNDVRIEARVGHRDGRMETVTTTLRIQSVEGAGG